MNVIINKVKHGKGYSLGTNSGECCADDLLLIAKVNMFLQPLLQKFINIDCKFNMTPSTNKSKCLRIGKYSQKLELELEGYVIIISSIIIIMIATTRGFHYHYFGVLNLDISTQANEAFGISGAK